MLAFFLTTDWMKPGYCFNAVVELNQKSKICNNIIF